jgi:hypothetical protein
MIIIAYLVVKLYVMFTRIKYLCTIHCLFLLDNILQLFHNICFGLHLSIRVICFTRFFRFWPIHYLLFFANNLNVG